ncbi:MAG: GNAT family N-acetyltransferase [Lachnospiraceae bacterium]|nr:GNAT family N-acetyltransferase [Lachnospiraceae bacterium]
MINLRTITEENFMDAFQLTLGEGQETYVSHPIRSLAQAYVYREQCQPFGIYCGEEMVGYVMVIYDDDIPEYDIWHMMIDKQHQGKGYGTAALQQVLAYIQTKPFGDSDRVTLTCHRENQCALSLYHHLGFTETGVAYEEELELSLHI